MKNLFKTVALVLISSSAFASKNAMYEISLTNLTKGQPIAPAAIITHRGHFELFKIGEKASEGLMKLAEDGNSAVLKEEVLNKKSTQFLSLMGLTLPGQTSTIKLMANRYDKLTLGAMLAKTNDGFIAPLHSLPLKLRVGQTLTRVLHVFDAGSERNNEMQAYIPAFGNPGVRTDEAEGFVTFHPGLQGIGDLNYVDEAFAPQAAKLVIKRIQ